MEYLGETLPAFSRAMAGSVSPRYSMWSNPTRVMAVSSGRVAEVASSRPPSPTSRIATSTRSRAKCSTAASVPSSK